MKKLLRPFLCKMAENLPDGHTDNQESQEKGQPKPQGSCQVFGHPFHVFFGKVENPVFFLNKWNVTPITLNQQGVCRALLTLWANFHNLTLALKLVMAVNFTEEFGTEFPPCRWQKSHSVRKH